jgi:2-C-methyl-D-erythritol 4-phosphate cytidylyltransferase
VAVGGRPMLAWSLVAMDAAERVEAIVVACPPGREEDVERIAAEAQVEVRAVPGGAQRSQSVALALEHVETELVAVHDAARPLVPADLIDEVLRRLEVNDDFAAVIAAAPVTDTIKEANVSRRVLRTPERSRMWAVQTPQAFRAEGLRDAVNAHPDELDSVTDDAQLIEREGGEVLIHEAPATNLKITTPLDLRVAEILLAERE